MSISTVMKGDVSEGFLIAALLRHGKTVLRPLGQNQRYDLVIDDCGFSRVQVKTGRLMMNGAVIGFNACSTNHRGRRRNYVGQIEFFGVYCPDNGKTYLVPFQESMRSDVQMRITPLKRRTTGQSNTRWAKDYEL